MQAGKTLPSPVVEPPQRPVSERRRSRRRRLQKPSEVCLLGTGDELEWRCRGALLNVSPEGIAVRVSNDGFRRLFVDQMVEAVFGLGPSRRDFELRGRITNITPAGTEEHWVVGLEFADDARLEACRPALREAIAHANDPQAR